MLATIFDRQLELQRGAFGVDPSAFTLAQAVEYIDWNLTALVQEVSEARDEISWKNWAADYKTWINTDALVGEMVDVLHFYINVMLAAGVTPEHLLERYTAKRKVNIERQEAGYEHSTDKCPTCGRAQDEPHS
jgi:phosphoribosyl-ATP pyrophosphohydrolase